MASVGRFTPLVLTLVLIAAACGGDDASTASTSVDAATVTSEDLIGTWQVTQLDYRQFHEDGSFQVALSVANMENSTVDQGEFTLEGTILVFISNADSAACEEGQRGSYEVEVVESGSSGEDRLNLTHVEDECTRRGNEGDRTMVRLP